jgi:transposase
MALQIGEAKVTGGVDTHKDFHVAAALDELGRFFASQAFPVSAAGYGALLGWLGGFGEVVAVGVEGTGSWGAGLARHLAGEGVRVVEVNRPNRQLRRQKGKSDPTDALAAARAVQSGEAQGVPKTADGPVEAIRALRVARSGAVKARTHAANQIHSLIDTAPEALRAELRALPLSQRIRRAARFRPAAPTTALAGMKLALASLARRWLTLDAEVTALDAQLGPLTAAAAPDLVAVKGVGPETAGALLVAAGDNPDRLRSEAAFAALCGVSPLDCSSGRQQRHRLNRGGNRQANWALHMIVVNRLAWHEPTRAYMARRITEGKTKKEAMRCLKRYLARQLYRIIRRQSQPAHDNVAAGRDAADRAAA